MRIESPDPKPRSEGDYRIYFSNGYGNPTGDIYLDEQHTLRLSWLDEGDCDRLIKAAAEIKQRIITARAEMSAPHGTRHLYHGTCQLCGKPEDDELHAEAKPLVISDSTIAQVRAREGVPFGFEVAQDETPSAVAS